MVYRNFYFHIVVRISAVVLTSLAIAFQWSRNSFDIVVILLLALLALQSMLLIRYMNRTNQLLSYFFDAVRNEDSSLVFTEKTGNRSFNQLHRSLNRLNRILRGIRMEIAIQETYYKTIVESTSTGIITFDTDGIIELANSAARELFQQENLHHIRQFDRICPRFAQLLQTIEEGRQRTLSCVVGERPMHLSVKARSLKLRDKKMKLLAIQDIRQELDEQELESWQKLIRILNHEIMNSVAPITSLSETITSYFSSDGKPVDSKEVSPQVIANSLKGLSVITEHGKGLIRFVESYRSLTRLPDPQVSECEVRELFERIRLLAGALMPVDEQGQRIPSPIETHINPPDLVILADEDMIAQVLFNLVKNALEALEDTKEPRLTLSATLAGPDNRPQIRIRDNGPGIPDNIREKVFVPFFSTRSSGSGIGLALSRQIMRLHNGSISLNSKGGEGTVIVLQF